MVGSLTQVRGVRRDRGRRNRSVGEVRVANFLGAVNPQLDFVR